MPRRSARPASRLLLFREPRLSTVFQRLALAARTARQSFFASPCLAARRIFRSLWRAGLETPTSSSSVRLLQRLPFSIVPPRDRIPTRHATLPLRPPERGIS